MKASVLPRFLLGSRDAITQIAVSPSALLIGALFTVSAGFAREYDGEDLLHEPWHALRPLGASLLSGTVLFGLIHGICSSRDPKNQRPQEPETHSGPGVPHVHDPVLDDRTHGLALRHPVRAVAVAR